MPSFWKDGLNLRELKDIVLCICLLFCVGADFYFMRFYNDIPDNWLTLTILLVSIIAGISGLKSVLESKNSSKSGDIND